MMAVIFDARHRWGPPDRRGVMLWRTCQACGRKQGVETLLPDAFLDEITLEQPNPYRSLMRAVRP